MCQCGQGREQLRAESSQETVNVAVKYVGVNRVRIRGARSGNAYEFSPESPDVIVSELDAYGLVATGLFVWPDRPLDG